MRKLLNKYFCNRVGLEVQTNIKGDVRNEYI